MGFTSEIERAEDAGEIVVPPPISLDGAGDPATPGK